MSDIIDLDALLSERIKEQTTEVRFRGRVWSFRTLADLPISFYADAKTRSQDHETEVLAAALSGAVDPDQLEDFAELTITAREAWALFEAITGQQQGLALGE